MINLCIITAKYWKKHFPTFKICIDTSKEELNYNNYADFSKEEKNAILFCACKHREGSDIKNLDCCIFLDKVENRNAKTFVQCIGRVLRRDKLNKKKEGVIIDLCASNCLKICDRMNNYLNCKSNFPWKYIYKQKIINKKCVFINQLKLIKNPKRKGLRLFLTEESKKTIHRISPRKNLLKDQKIYFKTKKELDKYSTKENLLHQGYVAEIEHLEKINLKDYIKDKSNEIHKKEAKKEREKISRRAPRAREASMYGYIGVRPVEARRDDTERRGPARRFSLCPTRQFPSLAARVHTMAQCIDSLKLDPLS